jgi:hypothetical protein
MSKKLPLPKLIKKAEKVFNAWIRQRDEGKNCITCNKPGDQAGHYWPVRYSGVRFNEMNVHIQESGCNKWKHGDQLRYRIKLVEMYGEDKVKELDELAIRTQFKKWDREELENIIKKYSQ